MAKAEEKKQKLLAKLKSRFSDDPEGKNLFVPKIFFDKINIPALKIKGQLKDVMFENNEEYLLLSYY